MLETGSIENIIYKLESIIKRGTKEKLNKREIAKTLAVLLFEISKISEKLVEVRDYETIRLRGAFRYTGQTDSMFNEGLIPEDVYKELKILGIEGHVGPSYLRIKGLLTHRYIRKFFAHQLALKLRDYFKNNPPYNTNGFIVCIPNMTGGVWIGDETSRRLEKILTDYKVWPCVPYMREKRKIISTEYPAEKLSDYVEGLLPSPKDTAAILCFEELINSAETTKNAIKVYKSFGYGEENGIKIVGCCVFDYGHPVGVERLKRLNVDKVCLVDGKTFFEISKELGYISASQYQTCIDWLTDPWEFTRKIIPYLKRLS